MIKRKSSYSLIESLCRNVDITIGPSASHDIQVHQPEAFAQAILANGSLGLGESYMQGIWDSQSLDDLICKLLRAQMDRKINPIRLFPHMIKSRLANQQNEQRALQVGKQHYDLGNDFYAGMLDSRLTYTCGYWRHADKLEEAQTAKLDLICRKLDLQPGMTVLDIGCGWGSFMSYASEHYGVHCTGCSISKEQIDYIKDRYRHLSIDFEFKDYRKLEGQYDRIVSIGMFEHVGYKNYKKYFDIAYRCLKEGGLFLLHTIGKHTADLTTNPWIHTYIFPNGYIPFMSQCVKAMEPYFVVEDLHNFGADYDTTLMAWHQNFEQSWPRFSARYGERFFRMWRYYLLSCAGAFRARDMHVWQWVLAKQPGEGGYLRYS